jgi:hypothetical protein
MLSTTLCGASQVGDQRFCADEAITSRITGARDSTEVLDDRPRL